MLGLSICCLIVFLFPPMPDSRAKVPVRKYCSEKCLVVALANTVLTLLTPVQYLPVGFPSLTCQCFGVKPIIRVEYMSKTQQ